MKKKTYKWTVLMVRGFVISIFSPKRSANTFEYIWHKLMKHVHRTLNLLPSRTWNCSPIIWIQIRQRNRKNFTRLHLLPLFGNTRWQSRLLFSIKLFLISTTHCKYFWITFVYIFLRCKSFDVELKLILRQWKWI